MASADPQTLHYSHSRHDEHPNSQPSSPHATFAAQSFSTMHRSLSSNALSSYDQSQPITFIYPQAQAVPITQATVLRLSSTGSDGPRESPRPVPALSVPPYTTANMMSLSTNGLNPTPSASALSMLSAQHQHQLLAHIASLSAPSPSGQAPPNLYIPQHPHVIHTYYPSGPASAEPHSPNYSFSDPEREEMDDEVFRPSTMNGSEIKTDLPLDPSQRRSLIVQEQQKILHANEKEDAHWNKQEQRFKKMVERLNTGAKTCEELHNFLLRSTKVMAAFSQAMLEQGSFGSRETGSLRQACIAQDVFGHSIYEHFGEMKERVFAESIKQANMLAQTMKKRVYTMQEMGVKHAKSIKVHRDKVAEAWAAYEKAFSERQKAELSNKPVRNDPFLACRIYDRELADLRATEKEYAKEMSKLFLELRIDDGRRIDAIKTIMLDYLLAQKALLEHTVKFTESVIASVKGVDREADVNEFITHADLLMNVTRDASGSASITPHTHTIFELPPPNRDPNTMSRLYGQEVEKEGMLCRQGKVFKSNWKDILVAISTSGFLHYFDDPKGSVPDLTICLSSCTVHAAPTVHSCAFEVHEPNRSFFNFSGAPTVYAFKADTEEQMEQWVAAIKKYTERTFTGSDLASPAAAAVTAATTAVGTEPSHVSTNPAISSRVSGPPSSAGSTGTAASHMAPSSSPNSSPSHSPTPVAGGDSPPHLPMPDSIVAGPPSAQLE